MIDPNELKINYRYESKYIPGYYMVIHEFVEWSGIPGANMLVEFGDQKRVGWISLADFARSIKNEEIKNVIEFPVGDQPKHIIRICGFCKSDIGAEDNRCPECGEWFLFGPSRKINEFLDKLQGFLFGSLHGHSMLQEPIYWIKRIREITRGDVSK